MRILFVRHGKSLANASGVVGTPDTPLAEEGIEQARITGRDLKSQHVTRIVCSSFIRAQQTAELIAGELGIVLDNITVIPELHERRMGTFEGKPKQCETAYFYDNDNENGFESHADLISRMQQALDKVVTIARQTEGTTVVVGHAASGFFLLQVAKGRGMYSQFDPFSQMGNAEFTEIEITDHHGSALTAQSYDIYKAAGLILVDRKVLATRSKGKTMFVQPGGKLEPGESELDALIRELREELSIEVTEADVEKIGDYYAEAAGQTGVRLKLAAYLVHSYAGTIQPQHEIEEIMLLGSEIPAGVEVASIMAHDILPELASRNLID